MLLPLKNGKIVGHLPLKKKKKKKNLQTTIFYFLRADSYENCSTTVTNKAVNLGDGDVMQLLALYTYQF